MADNDSDEENVATPLVIIVDTDQEVLESADAMLKAKGFFVQTYCDPSQLLDDYNPDRPGCLLIEWHLPGMTGLELLRRLNRLGGFHPIIFMTQDVDIADTVQAMQAGAVDVIQKPIDLEEILQRISTAVDLDLDRREQRAQRQAVEKRVNALTPREREVLELVVKGELTKTIAKQLGISTKTVEVHRSHITKKMNVQSVAHLVRIVTEHGLSSGESNSETAHRNG